MVIILSSIALSEQVIAVEALHLVLGSATLLLEPTVHRPNCLYNMFRFVFECP